MRRLFLLVWAVLLGCTMAAAQAEGPLTSSVVIRDAGDYEDHKIAQVTIVNVHEPERIQYTVKKIWQDDDNRAGIRGSYGVQLYANGSPVGSPVMLDADTTSYTWSNLYKNERGKEIEYTVDEVVVPEGYRKVVQGSTIFNQYVIQAFDGAVCKHWQDNGDQDGLRPQTVTLHLYAEGIRVLSLELTEEEGWRGTFGSLPLYVRDAQWMGWPIPADENDPWKKIHYTLAEEGAPGYTCTYEVSLGGFCVTNSHEPETIDIPVEKVWEDSDNKYKYRPETITVRLLVNGVESETMELSNDGGWRGVFSDKPVNIEGKRIEYEVIEDAVKRYKTEITGSAAKGFTIRNSLIYGYSFHFTKVWQDSLDEHPMPEFILYNPDGTVHRTQLQPPADWGGGHYVYSLVNEEDYYVVEVPMEGYYTEYVNTEKAEDVTDHAFADGTIINTAIFDIPVTSDNEHMGRYLLLLIGGVMGLVLLIRKKERPAGKDQCH